MNKLALQIGNNIRYFRKLKGMTQEDLAFATGCNSNHNNIISPYEVGNRVMGTTKLKRICDALDITMEEFFKNINL